MKSVILFGGSFDPVHDGHIHIANEALKATQADELWFIPAQVNPFKQKNTEFKDRLNMLQYRTKENKKFKISTIEGDRKGTSFTIDTVKILSKDNPNTKFYFLIGDDQIPKLDQWKNYEQLREMVVFIVYGRKQNQHDFLSIEGKLIDVSSSEIRLGTSTQTSGEVLNYIVNHGLYIHDILKYRLSAYRYEHILRVKDLALKIAEKHKINLKQTYIAAMWHDYAKEDKDLEEYIKKHMPHKVDEPPAFYHAYVAAHRLTYDYHYYDSEVLDAIASHVDGSSSTPIGMVLYIADKCEPNRKYETQKYVELSMKDLEKGFNAVKIAHKQYLEEEL